MTVTADGRADSPEEALSRWPQIVRGLLTFIRIALGGIWIYAGLVKITDIDQTNLTIRAFEIVPISWAKPMSYGLPAVEIALGLMLVVGLAVRWMAALSALFLLLYTGAIASAAARGLRIDCGCFSQGGQLDANTSTRYTLDILRDTGLFLLSALLVWRPRTYLSLDGWLRVPDTGTDVALDAAAAATAADDDDDDDDESDPPVGPDATRGSQSFAAGEHGGRTNP